MEEIVKLEAKSESKESFVEYFTDYLTDYDIDQVYLSIMKDILDDNLNNAIKSIDELIAIETMVIAIIKTEGYKDFAEVSDISNKDLIGFTLNKTAIKFLKFILKAKIKKSKKN